MMAGQQQHFGSDRERIPIRIMPVSDAGGYHAVGSSTDSRPQNQMRHFQLSSTEVMLDAPARKPWCQDVQFGYATFFLGRAVCDHDAGACEL
mmetsp:Transcript_39701/g.106902  ORF Transcript_39701/g.106902 Transcript_39701/m.106902 type:complete len:92 (+) Transcript_39701:26-301(+)